MKQFGLPPSSLLRTTKEFERVYQHGQRMKGNKFSLIYLANDRHYNRLGISIQKKTGTAVRRNRIKRLLRETFRQHRELFPDVSDIVITIRPGFTPNSLTDIITAIRELRDTQGGKYPA